MAENEGDKNNDTGEHRAPIFDQRGQKVQIQYNVAGDLNFGTVANPQEFIHQLEILAKEFANAEEAGLIDKSTAIEAKSHVDIAAVKAGEMNPPKTDIVGRLSTAKDIVTTATKGVATSTGLIKAIGTAIQVAQSIF